MWEWQKIQKMLWKVMKGVNMEEIFLYREKLEEIEIMVDELGVSL